MIVLVIELGSYGQQFQSVPKHRFKSNNANSICKVLKQLIDGVKTSSFLIVYKVIQLSNHAFHKISRHMCHRIAHHITRI